MKVFRCFRVEFTAGFLSADKLGPFFLLLLRDQNVFHLFEHVFLPCWMTTAEHYEEYYVIVISHHTSKKWHSPNW